MQSHDDFLREIEESENGHFLVEHRDGRAYLRVHPPGKSGTPVRLRDVEARLELFHLKDYDRATVEGIVAEADGDAHDIAPWEAPESIDARVEVEIAEDGMSAWLDVEPPRFGGRIPDEASLHKVLNEAGVIAGIDEETLGRIARGEFLTDSETESETGKEAADGRLFPRVPPAGRRFRAKVASGKRAPPGRPATIRHQFNPHPRAVPQIVDPGDQQRVDFRKLNVIQTCHAGDLLAEAVPGEEGAAGYTVRGEGLEPPPAGRVALEAGRNTRKSEDDNQLFATLDGQVRIEEPPSGGVARIDVEEILDLENVDYSVGHVDFPGTVRVAGSVLDGFEVKAAGDILVEKSVGNVRLIAGGDIVLQGGAACRNEGLIEAKGDVYARFVQDGGISASKSVYIEEAALNSRIVAAEAVYIEGGRGELMGGSTLAGLHVRTRKLSSRMEALTQITVGVSPEIMERLQSLNREFAEKHKTLRRVEQHLSQFDEAMKRGRKLEAEDEATLEKLRTIREKYAGVLQNLEDQRKYLYTTIEPSPQATVEAAEAVYPGVEVYFGAGVKRYRVEGRAHFVATRFLLEEGRIIMRHS